MILRTYIGGVVFVLIMLPMFMCGHCYGIDSSLFKYWGNVLIQALLWPITVPIILITGNPKMLIGQIFIKDRLRFSYGDDIKVPRPAN
jgi:hypothetical protein